MRDEMVSGKTRICGLIGDPVEHSVSPAMHNAAFRELGLDYLYLPFRVKKEDLSKAIEGMRAFNIRGLNVTIPHKVAVLRSLDRLDPLAEKIGAVNTIVNDDGVLTGYNTDASGFLQALLERGIEPEDKNVVILGAGGASRAISFILAERGAQIVILNRRLELDWAEELAGRISQTFHKEVAALELDRENLTRVLKKAEILVNATSVGMNPDADVTPVTFDLLKPDLVVYDIVYNPVKTRLLREAETIGAKTINGVDMLVWQGAIAFEKWTDQKAPTELMKEEVIKLLEEQKDSSMGKPEGDMVIKDMKNNIALIGFMGTGKTAVGQLLAEKLGRKFVELDSLVEQKAGKSIPEIFQQNGETTFRELEIEVTKEVANQQNVIIICGGGLVLNQINIDRLREDAITVYLTASPSVIQKRIASEEGQRPLLDIENPRLTIREMLKFRKPFYERAADITVNTSKLDINAVAEQIIEKLKEYESLDF